MILLLFLISLTLFIIGAVLYLRIEEQKKHAYHLSRSDQNPTLSPLQHSHFEAIATFNPAAYLDESGTVHLLYRAIGGDGQSRIGYAASADGLSVDERWFYPVFAMNSPRRPKVIAYDPAVYTSGGSWGGCEDPRVVRIEERIYLTFNAFDGWDHIRIGVSSITDEDFVARRWNWSDPLLISPADEPHKNWVLFPEKIGGKFAILHSITPHVQVDYVERLEDLTTGQVQIESIFKPHERAGVWDSHLRGVGAPPIRTEKGWLVLYHATQKHESHRYKVGAMLLDLDDPTKVIACSPAPILAPDAWYENDGKPGIVYVCGAVVRDEQLLVYYGAGDKHVCIAQTPLRDLLNWMLH